VQEIVTVSTER